MEEKKLNKNLSSLNVWALAFGCIIGWGAFVMPGNTFLLKAGPLGTIIGLVIASLIMVIIVFNYQFMISKYPVAGGEFVYAQKEFGEKYAVFCAWFLGLSYLLAVPLNATALALIGRNLLGTFFQVGFHYTVAGYEVYCGEIILAVGILLLFGWLSIRGVKFAGVFQTILVIALAGGVVVIGIAALLNPQASLSNLKPAYYPGSNRIAGVLSIIVIAPWAFCGFDTVPQAAEEFSFSHKKAKVVMIASIIFGGLVYIILNTVTASIIPDGYTSWVEYINDLNNLSGLISLPTFYAAHKLLGNMGLVVLGCAVVSAIFSGIIGQTMSSSRLLYSMARENVIPAWFKEVHSRYKTPSNSIIFVMGISLIAPFFGRTALTWLVDMASLGAAIGYGFTSAAALKCAIIQKNNKIIITGFIGTVMSIAFLVLLLVPIKMFGCSLGKESYICLAIWLVIGIIFFKKAEARKSAIETVEYISETK